MTTSRVNTDFEGPSVLAMECAQRDIQFMTFSSDLVFDGADKRPYVESSATNPLNYYGITKLEAERRVLAAMPSALADCSSTKSTADDHNRGEKRKKKKLEVYVCCCCIVALRL